MNTTGVMCPETSPYNNALRLSYVVWHSMGLLCVIFGLPGHLCQIIIMSNRKNRHEPTSLYFLSMAVCELLVLLGMFWLWCVAMSLVKIDPREVLSCGIFYSLLIGSTILSNLYLASLSLDRSVMILHPMRYRSLVTHRHVLRRIALILGVTVIFMIPHHFYYYYDPGSTIFLCQVHSFAQPWKIRLWPLIHAVVFVSIPSIITSASAVILLYDRCHRKHLTPTRRSSIARRLERNSILLFACSVLILFCLLPTVILEIFVVSDQLTGQLVSCSKRWQLYKILLHWFLTFSSWNYSVKFYVRLFLSRTFRADFVRLISCSSSRPRMISREEIPLK